MSLLGHLLLYHCFCQFFKQRPISFVHFFKRYYYYYTKQLAAIHILLLVAATQDADQHIRSLGVSILPKDPSTCRPGELNKQPSDNKTQALSPSHCRLEYPCFGFPNSLKTVLGWQSSGDKLGLRLKNQLKQIVGYV